MKYEVYVYATQALAKTELEAESKKEAREKVLQNLKNLEFKIPDRPFIVLSLPIKEVE